jgi:sugar phosphate isomerase/epimerase
MLKPAFGRQKPVFGSLIAALTYHLSALSCVLPLEEPAMDRRKFLTSSGALLAAGAVATAGDPKMGNAQPSGCAEKPLQPESLYTPQQQYRIGYTTNTRGGWEGDPFKGMREGREVGFRYMEIFGASFCRPDTLYYPDDAEGLMRRIFQMGVNFVSITGGSATGNTRFEDLDSRETVIENHFAMARFSRRFGCQVQKTNTGRRRPEGTTDADLKVMAGTLDALGKRMSEELGMQLGVHPHLGSQLQSRHELEYIMGNTDPKYVGLVLDTGHFTMAGMDPLAMGKQYGKRVLEYHLKDTKPEDRGGTKNVPGPHVDQLKDPYFFPMGTGGVDFPGLKAYLDSTQWLGFLNVELDTSPWRPPQESARITAKYIEDVLKIPL